MTNHARKPPLYSDSESDRHFLRMGYWPAAQRERQFAKEPDRTERMFMHLGYLISEVTFFLGEPGWGMGYMLGYNDGRTGLWTTPEDAIRAHRSKALVEVVGGSPYGLLTLGLMADYRLWAEGVMRGYELARERTLGGRFDGGPSTWAACPLDYPDLRDELLGLTDMPYTMACAIALWLTRDHATMYWLSFPQVL